MRTITIILLFSLGGCTMILWEPSHKQQEFISGFYVNTERNELLVAGRGNGYIFQIDSHLADALLLSRTIPFRPKFEDFKIDREHRVSGTLKLILMDSEINESLASNLTKIGFEYERISQKQTLTKQLSGKHYEIEGDLPLVKLEKEYAVTIVQPDSYSKVASKIIATPATITFDAVVVVPASLFVTLLMGGFQLMEVSH